MCDGTCAAAAVFLAYLLRFDGRVPDEFTRFMWIWTPVLALAWPTCLSLNGGYRSTWQHFGLNDMWQLATRAIPLTTFLLMVRTATPGRGVIPYTVVLIDLGIMILFSSCLRILRRVDHEATKRLTAPSRTLLIATESTVAGAIRQLRSGGGAHVIGILASDPALRGRNINGVPVLGTPEDLVAVVASHAVKVVILASVELNCIPSVLRITAELGISVRMLPSAEDLLLNKVQVSKRLSVQDLENFGEAKQALHPRVEQCLSGKVVLITGAGGSIGSEIARQVAQINIRRLLLLDQDENSIFELMNELKGSGVLVPVIADIRDEEAVRHLFASERPDIVLHAAAYKHVPMMELNPCEAILNNVCATRVLAEAAMDYDCERMVMISSDKAVRPSSIMGATKRLAELAIQNACAARKGSATRFACVRFGNVLGSRGSVLPLFLKQISAGGPVTVTDREMTRYFMTIPQAVRLVLQAATLAGSGDVFMLDMGNPVSIMSFAENVIRSAGLVLDQDIKIIVTGTRPGEKLHERLWSDDSQISETEFPQILCVKCKPVHPNLSRLTARLELAARRREVDVVKDLLVELPIDYRTDSADPCALPPAPRHEILASVN